MILRQIGENASGIGNALVFMIKERVRGDLRHNIFHTAFHHIRKNLMQEKRVRRGELGRDLFLP